MVKEYQIVTAYRHNLNTHKIGETDGFTSDVAADLGFETPDRLAEIIQNLGSATSPAELILSSKEELIASGPRELPEVARRAIELSHEIAGRVKPEVTPTDQTEPPTYLTRAMHGMKVDAARKGRK